MCHYYYYYYYYYYYLGRLLLGVKLERERRERSSARVSEFRGLFFGGLAGGVLGVVPHTLDTTCAESCWGNFDS